MIVGIDLGTTNSLVSIFKDGEAVLVPNALGNVLTPSVVGLDDDGRVVVGEAARERLITHPHLTAANFKRFMGSNKVVHLGKKAFSPEELSALVLRSLKSDVEHLLGELVEEAVITVPAYFNDIQRKATKNAGLIAGPKVERLLNEPTAAALAYGLHRKDVESYFMVLDLGGGTFDVSVLELFEGVMEVHASTGDNYLGGEDFVSVLVEMFMAEHGESLGGSYKTLDSQLQNKIRQSAEAAKRSLSHEKTAKMKLRHEGRAWFSEIGRAAFEEASKTLLGRLRSPLEQALRDARIRAADLDAMVLVGGATRMPMVRQLAARVFGKFPQQGIHPDHAIALGAGVQAALKERNKDLNEVVLTDVCPYTLGILTVEQLSAGRDHHVFSPILERNTVVPASRVERFHTIQDQQRVIDIVIFQGESRHVQNNIQLGKLRVKVPPKPKGEEMVDVRFTYDINGLLEVDVTVVSTGKKASLLIEENPGALGEEEIASRRAALANLKTHPRDDALNRALLARADRFFCQSLGELRELIGARLGYFRGVLESQDSRIIAPVYKDLSDFLDEIEANDF